MASNSSRTHRPRAASARRGTFPLRLSPGGVALGLMLFCASLTPSLVPRSPELQGLLGGVAAALGYLIWRSLIWLWYRLEIPTVGWTDRRAVRLGLLAASGAVTAGFLYQAADWQNSIRTVMGMPPVDTAAPLMVAGVAVPVFLVLLAVGRSFRWLFRLGADRVLHIVPRPIAHAAGLLIAVLVFVTLIQGVLLRGALRMIDASSRAADAIISTEFAPPVLPGRSGSADSLVAWEELGRWGRHFVSSAPSADEISAFWGEPAREPLRVYVGMTAAETAAGRARLAFEELLRAGGFEREVLVIAVPTGSGWLDPGAMDSLEFMHRGDVATVAVQYSYLSSWVSVLVEPGYGTEETQAIFDLVYEHWAGLPPQDRPRLYLHGLSLGASLSQRTAPLLDVLGDPLQGALWAGSPFLSEFWRLVVDRRQPDSPAWRPRFGNGSLIRTMNQENVLDEADAPWGPMRLVFLQYASDPIVFFDHSLAFRRPDWLAGERGPDVSPRMRWIPIVTMLQVGLDMAVALGIEGFGHEYIARDYIPAWAAVTEPAGWTKEREQALQRLFEGRPARPNRIRPGG